MLKTAWGRCRFTFAETVFALPGSTEFEDRPMPPRPPPSLNSDPEDSVMFHPEPPPDDHSVSNGATTTHSALRSSVTQVIPVTEPNILLDDTVISSLPTPNLVPHCSVMGAVPVTQTSPPNNGVSDGCPTVHMASFTPMKHHPSGADDRATKDAFITVLRPMPSASATPSTPQDGYDTMVAPHSCLTERDVRFFSPGERSHRL